MNIIELVRDILMQFPRINEIAEKIHIDFTDSEELGYGLSPTGDTLISKDILGNEKRQHNFILYAIYQSHSDYDRISNSGVLLELQMWLERHAKSQLISVTVGDETLTGELTKLTCSNGMIYSVPTGNLTDGVCYQLQISAQYKIESEM